MQSVNSFLGVLLGGFFFLCYYGLLYVCAKKCGMVEHYRGLSKTEKNMLLLLIAGVTAFFSWLCLQDDYIVNWDNGFYWIKNLNFMDNYLYHPAAMLKNIYESINLTDYSDMIPAIMSLPFYLIGSKSYALYRIQMFIMFQLPAYFFMVEIINQVLKKIDMKMKRFSYLYVMTFCMALSFLYLPTLCGLFDIADLTVEFAICLLILFYDFDKFNPKFGLLLSVMFLCLLFLRRHFAFFALAYFGCYVIVDFASFVTKKDHSAIIGAVKNFFFIGFLCSTVLLCFFRAYLERTLLNNYSVQYSARSNGTLTDKYIESFQWIGLAVCAFALIGLGMLFYKRMYKLAVTWSVSMVFTMFLFFRIQNLSMQHYYNFAPQIVFLSAIGTFGIMSVEKKAGVLLRTGGGVIVLCCFLHGLVPAVHIPNQFGLFPSLAYQPEIRSDRKEIELILKDARKLALENQTTAYCIASSGVFNDDILKNCMLPEVRDAFPELCRTLHTDLAGGFPEEFFSSGVILATEPAQTHANANGQRIIWKLNELVTAKNSPIHDCYEVYGTYEIEKETKVILLEKIKPFEPQDYVYLMDVFEEWYADYPELFRDRIQKAYDESLITFHIGLNDGFIILGEGGVPTARQTIVPKYGLIEKISFQIGTNGTYVDACVDVKIKAGNTGCVEYVTSVDLSAYQNFEFVDVSMNNLKLRAGEEYEVEFSVASDSEESSVLLLTSGEELCIEVKELASIGG